MRILIIEDQEKLASLLKKSLEKEGYAADYLMDGESGQRRIELHSSDYDLIILDLMLPKRDGHEVCKNVRNLGIKTPILILTAKDNMDDKVLLLDAGADDYLVKPFSLDELMARVRALTRRPPKSIPSTLRISDIILNPGSRKVFKGEKELDLTLKEFRLLEYLMRNPDQVLERESILSNIWDFDFNSFSNVIDVYINRLRQKLGKRNGQDIIETVRGVGYRIKSS